MTSNVALMLGAVLAATCSLPARSQVPSVDETAIRAARDRSNNAIAMHDADGTARAFLPDYVAVLSGNARTIGPDAARASYLQFFTTRPGVVFIRTPRRITVNTTWGQAGEIGEWTGQWTSADGVIRVGGEYFAKWKKVDGEWGLLAETFVQVTCSGGHYCDAPPDATIRPRLTPPQHS